MARRYTKGRSRSYSRPARRSYGNRPARGRAVRRGYSAAARTQRIEIVHVMQPGGGVALAGNSPMGTVGLSVNPAKPRGRTF